MSNLAEKYNKLSDHQKNLVILIAVAIIGALICVAFIFMDNVGVLLGWLLGSAVNIFAYVTMHMGSASLLNPNGNPKSGYLAMVWAILRLFLYAGCLLLSGFATFKWGTLAHGYCNIISCALALMPTWITLVVTTLHRSNKHVEAQSVKAVEQPKEETKEEGE